jgi:hypothetical protein
MSPSFPGRADIETSFRDGPKDQTSDVQLHIGESRGSGFAGSLSSGGAERRPVGAPRNDEGPYRGIASRTLTAKVSVRSWPSNCWTKSNESKNER